MNERAVSLVSEWKSFVNSENYNLIEKCLKLAQILEYPELDVSKEIEDKARRSTFPLGVKGNAFIQENALGNI